MPEFLQTVDSQQLQTFLCLAKAYNDPALTHRVDQDTITGDEIKAKPYLYLPCLVRQAGKCPHQKAELPSCHSCTFAETDHELLVAIMAQHGYSFDRVIVSHGIGRRCSMYCNTGDGRIHVEHNGMGHVVARVPYVRRLYDEEQTK